MKPLTYNKYRLINIAFISVIFVFLESIITLGANVWYPELAYTLSLGVVFMSLEMMRWKSYGVISVILSGLTFCLASGASPQQFVIYCVGNLLALLNLLYLKKLGCDRVRNSTGLTVLYVVLTFLLVQIGRWLVALVFGGSPLLLVQFLTTDALSGVFAIVVILILRNADGMFENQLSYLRRLEEEREKKRKKQEEEDELPEF